MTRRRLGWTLSGITALCTIQLASASSAIAQCSEWDGRFDPGTFLDGGDSTAGVYSAEVFDDGGGPALYVGGQFKSINGVTMNGIAKRVGPDQWAPLGSGLTDGFDQRVVVALKAFDDGSGPVLYVGGHFTSAGGMTAFYVARWHGTNWSAMPIAMNSAVRAFAVVDFGAGPALYAAGSFTQAGGSTANRVARWNGNNWAAVGTGVNGTVECLAAFDDGTGIALYAGGAFTTAGGANAARLARWNGAAWSAVGIGFNDVVRSMAVFDDGSGEDLYVGGMFTAGGGIAANRVARWDGSAWSDVGGGMTSGAGATVGVSELHVSDEGGEPALYAGGAFTQAGSASARNIARWDGDSWSAMDQGVPTSVEALATAPLDSQPTLFAGSERPASRVVWWDGEHWQPPIQSLDAAATTMVVLDDGSGPALYAGGDFVSAGDELVYRVARWNGSDWSPLGSGINDSVAALGVFDDGGGPALYAGGEFTAAGGIGASRIAKWNGASWSALGSGVTGGSNIWVYALTEFDDGSGPALYAGGRFTTAGGVAASGIAKWDGTAWASVGSGVAGGSAASVRALAVFDDGAGAAIYAGGDFLSAGGGSANRIAKWDGATWSALGGGIDGIVLALVVFDDGSGPALYAGGTFLLAGGASASCVARWDGASWSPLGSGVDNTVSALAVFDDGSGPALYAGGVFTMTGGASANRIARWDGSTWSALGAGVNNYSVSALAVFDDGADGAPDLFAGGPFIHAGGQPSRHIAQWHGCEAGDAYCFGDGVDPLVTAQCPCGNLGEPGRGCANSNSALGGARLYASGSTNPNTLLFTSTGIPNNSFCTFLRSLTNDDSGFVFGDGIKCASGSSIRFGSQNAGQGGNPAFTVSSGAVTIPSGNTRYYQLHYRNPNAGFCPPESFNISNGYRVTW